jgi:inosine-uridine nucleoside N-ribohydrolase
MIFIDTDAGIDDAVAILIAFAELPVIGISTVAGNVDLHVGNKNIDILAAVAKQQVALYSGCSSPLIPGYEVSRWPGHDTDGLGGFSFERAFQEFKVSNITRTHIWWATRPLFLQTSMLPMH